MDAARNGREVFERWVQIGERQLRAKPGNAKRVSRDFDIEAFQKSISMDLDMPVGKPRLSASRSGASQQRTHLAPVFRATVSQANSTDAPSLIQAAATDGGGGIITPCASPNFSKAEQFTNFVHIRSRGTGPSKTPTSSKASTMTSEPATWLCSAQHPELPNCSAPAPSPPVPTIPANIMPKVAVVNCPQKSASTHLLETDRAVSTVSKSRPWEDLEMDDESSFYLVTMEDFLTEDMEQLHIVDLDVEEMIDPEDADMVVVGRHEVDGPSVDNWT
ncbi:hypothetical protein ZWY2020_044818 [Hordeum vulgare]|nr:hypothetical protein ZWY2020_044818 [Hordeum vulgare]